ncbi:MAG: hypothetical protein NVSMB47_05400 [Polyangiales bacterium]
MRRSFSLAPLTLLIGATALGCGASKSPDNGGDCLGSDCPGTDGGFSGDAPSSGFDVAGDGNPEGGLVFQDITLTPSNATIYIDTATTPATAAIQAYTATLNLTGGGTKDVTSSVVLSVEDPSLGKFTGNTFSSVLKLPGTAAGVTTVVHGTAETKQGSANLTIVALRKTGDHRDFFFVVPYLGPPTPDRDVLKFGTNIKQVDVAFSVDTTGSMGSSISNLKTSLSSTIIPAIAKAIPSVGIGVAYHDDYPYGGHGNSPCGPGGLPGDVPEGTITVVTADVPTAQAAANKLEVHCGGDEPEAQEASMYHILTGSAISSSPAIAAHTPAPGTTGAVDFRAGALPVVVEITDAHWHDTDTVPPGLTSLKVLTAAFKGLNARFVGVTDMHYASSETSPFPLLTQPEQLADSTGSNVPPAAFAGACGAGQCCTGLSGAAQAPAGPGGSCRLSFQIQDGTGLGDSVVKAIQAISVGSTFDVTAVAANDPANADAVDATKFIKALRAMDEGSAKSPDDCPPHAAKDTNGDGIKDTFVTVVVGTPVCFEILPQENTTVHPKTVAQFFNAFIDVLGMPGSVKLDRRNVLFLVPPKEPAAK